MEEIPTVQESPTATDNPTRDMALDALVDKHEVELEWVKGHAGHPENERADRLANEAIDRRGGLGAVAGEGAA